MDELIHLIERQLDAPLPIGADTPLLSSGVIGSFQVAALLAALEERFQTRIDPASVGVDNFDTPQQMLRFLQAGP